MEVPVLQTESTEPIGQKPASLLVELMRRPYDELVEIDLIHGRIRNIDHVEGKYYVPVTQGDYEDMQRYAAEHMVHPDDREIYLSIEKPEELMRRLESGEDDGVTRRRLRYRMLGGGWRWVDQINVGGTRNGVPRGIVYSFVFDAENHAESGQTAERNALTGLNTESVFYERGKALLRSQSEGWCVVSLDIEHFQLFNDWYGREQGDLLLAQIGAELMRVEKETGGVAGYLAQDDFLLLIPYDLGRIREMYDRIHAMVKEHGTSVGFLPAVGIAPVETDGETALEDYCDRASLASRRAKDGYRARIRVFDPSMIAQTERDYQILSDFQKGMENHELFIQLQPQCRISTGKVVGAESLVRWKKADGAFVPPSEFVPVLERNGFVTDLDKFVWEEVCAWQRKWIDGGHTPLPVSVNVSQIDIFSIDVPLYFEHLLEKYALPVETIKIEITESAYADNETVASTVRRLRELGFLVLMDDFGSGYSSLNMLGNLNVDVVKLDAKFLHLDDSDDKKKGIHILESIVNMVKSMALPIIVEGVETKEQSDFLAGLGCRYVQGYYFYHPLPVEEFEKIIEDPEQIDTGGLKFKANEEFHFREFLDQNVYSDSMLNNVLGAVAFYSWNGDDVDIVRFNQKFYDEVKIPNFNEHTKGIHKMALPEDLPVLYGLFQKAEEDSLNGATGVVRFFKPDGSICQHRMHFYFLGKDERGKRFYGSIHDLTEFITLNDHMRLLSRVFPDSVVFLRRREGRWSSRVVIHGLRGELGLDAPAFEQELNDGVFLERMDEGSREQLRRIAADPEQRTERFSAPAQITSADGSLVDVTVWFIGVHDKTSGVEYIMMLRKDESRERGKL